MIMPPDTILGQLLCSIGEQRISSYKRFNGIVHQIHKEPNQAIYRSDRLVGEMGASDPLYPLVGGAAWLVKAPLGENQ